MKPRAREQCFKIRPARPARLEPDPGIPRQVLQARPHPATP